MNEFFNNNIKIPRIGMGSTQFWNNTSNENTNTLLQFINTYGPVMVDTAEMYGHGKCERVVGDILQHVNREDVYLIGKILPDNCHPSQFHKSLTQTLQNLQTSYLDLYLLHWREDVDLHYLVQAMEEEVKKGTIKHWGVSNFDYQDMLDLLSIPNGDHCFANQIFYNLYTRGAEFDLFPLMQEHNILPMSYSTLGSKYTDSSIVTNDTYIKKLMDEYHISAYTIMLAFNIYQNVAALFSTKSLQHMQDNMKCIDFDIEPHIEELNRRFPSPTKAEPLQKI